MFRRNPSSRSASSQKVEEKFAFLSLHVGRPGKTFLDHITISKLYPWAKTNIKCPNRKNWHVRGHRYAIPPRQISPIPPIPIKILTCTASMRVSHSTAVQCAPGSRKIPFTAPCIHVHMYGVLNVVMTVRLPLVLRCPRHGREPKKYYTAPWSQEYLYCMYNS